MSVSIANGKKDEKDVLLCEKITKTKIKGKPALPPVAKSNLYKTQLCRNFMSNGKCKYGRVCQFAHGRKELEKYSCTVCWGSGTTFQKRGSPFPRFATTTGCCLL